MMEAKVYSSREWRELPRDGECAVAFLFGERFGVCAGPIHRHHVDPPNERSIQVCRRHHPKLESVLRKMDDRPGWKRCRHIHRTREARLACERRLNGLIPQAA